MGPDLGGSTSTSKINVAHTSLWLEHDIVLRTVRMRNEINNIIIAGMTGMVCTCSGDRSNVYLENKYFRDLQMVVDV